MPAQTEQLPAQPAGPHPLVRTRAPSDAPSPGRPGSAAPMSAGNWALLGLLSLLWGGSFFFVEVAVPHLPALSIVLVRVALAALALLVVLRVTQTALPRGAAVWGALAVMGLMNNAVPFSLFVLAQGRIESSLAAILNATTPLFAVIVAHVATHDERLTPMRAAGVLAGFAGVVVVMGVDTLTRADGTLPAKLACLGAALAYALSGIWGRRFRRMGVSPLATAFGQCLCASVILAPVVLLVDRPWALAVPPLPVLAALAALALVSTAFAYLLYFRLLASSGAVNLLLVTFLVPVSASLLGVFVLGEALLPRYLVGFGMIGLGLAAIDGRLGRIRLRGTRRGSSK